MSEAEPAPEPAPPVRGQWAWQRVAALPAAVRQRCLDNAVGACYRANVLPKRCCLRYINALRVVSALPQQAAYEFA
jgi:hypothetical protein